MPKYTERIALKQKINDNLGDGIMDICNWCHLSDEEKRWLLIKNENWSVYLADDQDYIGRCILVLNRHCGCLSELTDNEWIDLKHIIDRLENCFKTALGAELCNWSCLLNDFYKRANPNPHLHLHVRPRYKIPFSLNGVQYVDEEFGHHYNPKKGNMIDIDGRRKIYDILKSNLMLY